MINRLFTSSERKQMSGDPRLPAALHPCELSQLFAAISAVQPRRMIEWGSGGTTLVIPGTFQSIERYVSVEHNEQWHARVGKVVDDPRVSCLFRPPHASAPEPAMFEESGGKTRQEYVDWTERCENEREILERYVEAPFEIEDEYDVALIDGRARRFCIERAWQGVRSGGLLLIHDSQRDDYKAVVHGLGGGQPLWLEPWHRGQVCVLRRP